MAGAALQELRAGREAKTVIIGTAGHIDHGKTALIRALTGIDTDRLPEEKQRGITIDLGFASLELAGPDGLPVRASFIDVPGHARFVRNMLAGAGGIDAVLLVISAEEGVKPQTEEHLAICSLLGIQRGLTVLTKIDAVEPARFSQIQASVERFLSSSFLASEPVIGASAFTGAGVDELRRELGRLAARIGERNPDSIARLPLDRSFAIKGFGTVVTGTLLSGSVETGQELAVEPGGRSVKVRGIQMHGRAAARADAATRVALNLSRVEATELRRGDTLVEASIVTAVDTVDVQVNLLAGASALKHRARVHFHAFATECMATVSFYGQGPMEARDSRLARLRLAHPTVLLPGDRFVLRQGSPSATIGGGVVLDAHPLMRVNKARTQEWLEHFLSAQTEEQLALRVRRRGMAGVTIDELRGETGLKEEAVRAQLARLTQSGKIHSPAAGRVLSRESLLEASAVVRRELERIFRQTGGAGVKRSALKSQVPLRPDVIDSVVRRLEHTGNLRVSGEELLPPGTERAGRSLDQDKLDAIDRVYRKAGLVSPSPGSLAGEMKIDPSEMRRLISVLLREKKLVRLGDDSLCVHQEALAELKEKVRSLSGRSIDVALFKELTGVSRKYAIPLLEYLDRERVTRREGDRRIVF